MYHAGTYAAGATIRIPWSTSAADGASITRSTNGTVAVWKDGGATQSTAGITDTEDFDSMTGMHMVVIDTSADGTFYSTGSEFHVAVTGATIDTETVNAWIGGFRLGTDIISATAVRSAVGLASANLDTQLTTIDDFLDTEIAAIKAKTDNLPSDPADASVIAGRFDTLDASIAVVDGVVDDILVDTGTTLPAAIDTIDNFLDTEVAAIKAKTDNLPSDPADASDIAALFDALPTAGEIRAEVDSNSTQLAAISGYVDALETRLTATRAGYLDHIDTINTLAGGASGFAAIKGETAAILDDTGSAGVVVASGSKTGYTLSSAGVAAIWAALTSGLSTSGSIGKLIVDNLDAAVSTVGGGSLTVQDIVDGVLDELMSAHTVTGSVGAGIAAAGSAGDPWSTVVPGAYGAGTAGAKIGALPASPAATGAEMRLVDGAVTAAKIGSNAITAAKIASSAIGAAAVSAGAAEKIADTTLRRDMENVAVSSNGDTLNVMSLFGVIALMMNSTVSGTTLTLKKPDGTTLGTLTLTTSPASQPVTGVVPT